MIHRIKKPDGSDSFRAYSIHDRGDDNGHCAHFVEAFDTSEAAKDRLIADLARQVRAFDRDVRLLRMVLEHEGLDHISNEDCNISDLREKARELESDVFFLADQAESLFAPVGAGAHHVGIIGLHGEAAIEYARRHGYQVRHTEYDSRGNYEVDELVTPGRAHELLPENKTRRLFIDVPRDTVTPDLPPSYGWYEMQHDEEKRPRTPAEWRKFADDYRAMVKGMLERADEFERIAEQAEATQP